MKKLTPKMLVKASLLSLSIFASSAFAAGVPVIDLTAIGEAIVQTSQQVQQIKNQVKQFDSINGGTGLGDLLNNPDIRKLLNKHLPKNYNDVYEAMRRGDLGALQSVYDGVIADEKQSRIAKNGKERLAATMLLGKAQMLAMMDSLTVRSNNMVVLGTAINGATDNKAKVDLANRLMLEQAMITVDMNRMQVAMQINAQNEKLAQRQIMSETRDRQWGEP